MDFYNGMHLKYGCQKSQLTRKVQIRRPCHLNCPSMVIFEKEIEKDRKIPFEISVDLILRSN